MDNKRVYSIDLKIYEPANMYEVPFPLPESVLTNDGFLKLGYQTVVMHCTEEIFDEFNEWCHGHGAILKIVGSEILG